MPRVGEKADWTRGSQGVRVGRSKEGFVRKLGPEQVCGFGVGVAVVRGVRAVRRRARKSGIFVVVFAVGRAMVSFDR
jgi:hypothetical protein